MYGGMSCETVEHWRSRRPNRRSLEMERLDELHEQVAAQEARLRALRQRVNFQPDAKNIGQFKEYFLLLDVLF